MSDGNIFLLSWDCNGLESCINISDIEKQHTWAVLGDKESPVSLGNIVNAVILRARYNSQRHYEVYTITVEESITVEDMQQMFEDNPQYAAELIRDRGNKIYSDRFDTKKAKIV